MRRREFIKLSIAAGSALLLPNSAEAKRIDFDNLNFDSSALENNNAQTIIVFLYGGASQLGGNLVNIDEIEQNSQNSYHDYFRGITKTENNCWQEAGGKYMEEMIKNGDMTLYRSCYSPTRERENNKSHGLCVLQNQRGTFDVDGAGGIVGNIAAVLYRYGKVGADTPMPFVTMEGDSHFYDMSDDPTPTYLKPAAFTKELSNPYERSIWTVRRWFYYNEEEQKKDHYDESDEKGGFDPQLTKDMDTLAQSYNKNKTIKDDFDKRAKLDKFIKEISNSEVPDLGDDSYADDDFSKKLKTAVTLLDKNPSTKILTLNTGGLGGWDDHNGAREYVIRMEHLFKALKSATAHLKAIDKIDTINIMVFGDFGRNVNLNSAYGWDHGNLQNLYVIGGKKYFTHQGIVGETVLDVTGKLNRLWLKPKDGTYTFEPLSIAATIYKLYGIENPNALTGGNYPPVNVLS